MKKFTEYTLKEFSSALSEKKPVPGGGSVSALTAALALGLIVMVARYSIGKQKTKKSETRLKSIIKKAENLRRRALLLIDKDAQAYLKVVNTRKGTERQKKAALRGAQRVPLEVSKVCYDALQLTPDLVLKGSKYLISDVEVAVEMLFAAYKSAMINVKINQ